MEELKQELYARVADLMESKKTVLFWNGDAFSTLIWWLANDLNLEFDEIVFVDNGEEEIRLYTHMAAFKQEQGLEFKTVDGEFNKKAPDIAEGYDVAITGRPQEFGKCPLPLEEKEAQVWNFIKLQHMPLLPIKRNMLG